MSIKKRSVTLFDYNLYLLTYSRCDLRERYNTLGTKCFICKMCRSSVESHSGINTVKQGFLGPITVRKHKCTYQELFNIRSKFLRSMIAAIARHLRIEHSHKFS